MAEFAHRHTQTKHRLWSNHSNFNTAGLLLVLGLWLTPAVLPVNAAPNSTIVAWGDNTYGQTNVPAGLSGVTAITAGVYHAAALKSDGSIVAWGYNNFGQTNVPTGLGLVTAIAAGYFHTVALKNDGTVMAWGLNSDGETSVPVGLTRVTAIAAGYYHTMALRNDGTVVAWGYNSDGETDVPAGLTGVTAIAGGGFHSVALKSDGTVVAWGDNSVGESSIPASLTGVTAIAAGQYFTMAIITLNITGQPMGQSFAPGGAVNLSVTAAGLGLGYQWQFNGVNILGATNSTLTISNLTAMNAGAYTVAVSSSTGGAIISQTANLFLFGDLKFYAGTTLAGPIGQQFRVDFADVLVPGTTNWQVLTNITLAYSPYLVIDPASPGRTNRFYRAVTLP